MSIPANDTSSIPACVFARPGVGPRTLFAVNSDGGFIHIEEAPRGLGELVCPDCGGALIAKKGDIRRPHYAHLSGVECMHAGETALHLMAKEIIASGASLAIPPMLIKDASGKVHQVRDWATASFDAVEVEVWEGGLRPDLIGSVNVPGQSGVEARRLIIEIRVANAVDGAKLEKLRARGESVLEIDLSRIDRDLDREALAELLIEDAPRSWLFHRDEERARKELEKRLWQEERQRDRRKAWAISAEARSEAERQTAREVPPKGDTDRLLGRAEIERRNWCLIGCATFYEVAADDGIFDVSPIVWRSKMLRCLAPWGVWSGPGMNPDLSHIAKRSGEWMREAGWVKEIFSGKLTRFTTRREDWDPVGEALEAYVSDSLTLLGYGKGIDARRVDMSYAWRTFTYGWHSYEAFEREVLNLRGVLIRQEMTLSIAGRQIDAREDIPLGLVDAHYPDIVVRPSAMMRDITREVRASGEISQDSRKSMAAYFIEIGSSAT